MKSFTSFIFIFLALPQMALAYNAQSLTWQKLALEEKVQRKFNNLVSTLLKDNQYLVEVEVEVVEPGSPNFEGNNKPTGPKVSDFKLEESRGDYIAFSKIGLEVPVVEKFLDEDKTKLMNLYRYNETFDLFKNLSSIKVTIYLSDKIPTDLSEMVKKLVQNSKLAVSGIKPTVAFENTSMEWVDPAIEEKARQEALAKAQQAKQRPKEDAPRIWLKDWLEWASRWGNAFGIILGSIIIGMIALSLFKRWQDLMEKLAAMQRPEANKEEDKDSPKMISPNLPNQSQEEDVASSLGLQRFQQCLSQHPEEATTLIKTWINEGEDSALLALRAIAQQVSPEEMDSLLNVLSEQQRDKWKGLLGVHLESGELAEANKFIFQEVVRSILVPSPIKDGELLNLIMELTPENASTFLEEYSNHIGIMMNLLGPAFVSKILLQLDEATTEAWLTSGAEFEMSNLEKQLPSLKEDLVKFKNASAPAPFAQRLMAMIPTASAAKERTLYQALIKSGDASMAINLAKKFFPAELITNLPAPFLKEVIQSYPMAKRVELIFSRSNDKDLLLNTFAEPGTPARDLMDMELENISRDEARQNSINQRSEEIWQDFVKLTRQTLAKNPVYSGTAEQLVTEWSKSIQGLRKIDGGRAA
ncbi:MAG: hypothetical protein AB7I27_10200 [Bacteriovoracaceae bacterium]